MVYFYFSALHLLMKQAARPNSPLKGHERTVQYLQHLGMNVQLRHNSWRG